MSAAVDSGLWEAYDRRGEDSLTTMIAELYDAPIAAGAPEDKARKASEAMAAYESRFAKIDIELSVIKWMVGFNLAATVALLLIQLRH